jgi:hypothetical protein
MYVKLLREKNQMHVKFEDSVWIAQSATCGNTQNIAVDLTASYTEAVLALYFFTCNMFSVLLGSTIINLTACMASALHRSDSGSV